MQFEAHKLEHSEILQDKLRLGVVEHIIANLLLFLPKVILLFQYSELYFFTLYCLFATYHRISPCITNYFIIVECLYALIILTGG